MEATCEGSTSNVVLCASDNDFDIMPMIMLNKRIIGIPPG